MRDDLSILGFGASAVDDILYVSSGFGAGKGRILRREQDYGGNVATALVAAAKLGGRAGFIGWLSDQPGEASAIELTKHGVDTRLAPRRPDASPIRSTIIVSPDGDRFIAYDDDVPHGTADSIADDILRQARVLVIDGYAVHSIPTVERARALGLAVVGDIEWSVGRATDELLQHIDHLVVPYDFARDIAGSTDVAAMLSALWSDLRGAVVVTHGAGGCYVRQRGEDATWHVPAHEVVAIDTTGAGDCFHGAYAVCLAEGRSPLESALFATAASAISVTGQGGRKALPDRSQVLALLAQADAPRPVRLG